MSRSVKRHARFVRAAVKNSHAAARHESGGCKLRACRILLAPARQLASDPTLALTQATGGGGGVGMDAGGHTVSAHGRCRESNRLRKVRAGSSSGGRKGSQVRLRGKHAGMHQCVIARVLFHDSFDAGKWELGKVRSRFRAHAVLRRERAVEVSVSERGLCSSGLCAHGGCGGVSPLALLAASPTNGSSVPLAVGHLGALRWEWEAPSTCLQPVPAPLHAGSGPLV